MQAAEYIRPARADSIHIEIFSTYLAGILLETTGYIQDCSLFTDISKSGVTKPA